MKSLYYASMLLMLTTFGAIGYCLATQSPLATDKPPLSAIAVSQCGLAVALFIQLDDKHLMRADPRQSDLFTNVDGHQVQSTAGPMKWEDAIGLASKAVLSSHVTLPCDSKDAAT
jgi:hypothetical protein